MSSSYGENIRMTVFGQSHSAAIGVVLEGIPAGKKFSSEKLSAFMTRRAPGRSPASTARKEADIPEFLSGVTANEAGEYTTCGAPLTAIIRNTNQRSGDYDSLKDLPRPGHADYTAHVKYFGAEDRAGGGHFSGRLTAPMCIAGGICLQLLEQQGIRVRARIVSIGQVTDPAPFDAPADPEKFPCVSETAGQEMLENIARARASGDSLGGVIECIAEGLPAGLGDPMFDGMENRIAGLVFGIPAVKGLEFGDGFDAAKRTGSENNDEFAVENGRIITKTNHCGGILGGITNGMPLTFRVAIKPTPSIARTQQTVNLKTLETAEISVPGRHDPCIVPRAVPCVEACAALAIYDALLGRQKELAE